MELSKRQQDILDTWKNTNKNIVIEAVAGAGKTFILLEILKLCDNRAMFLAFNKRIQVEIQNKINERNLIRGKALTLHSLGLKSLYTNSGKSVKVDNGKNYKLINKIFDNNKKVSSLSWKKRMKLFFFIMSLNDVSRMYYTNNFEKVLEGAELVGTLKPTGISDKTIKNIFNDLIAERDKIDSYSSITVDFIDMIYLPVKYNLKPAYTFKYLLIDECQDLNYVQHKFIDLIIKYNKVRWIAVGDRNQSIYGFAGSHNKSFNLFTEKDNTVVLPLDICYRCSKEVFKVANRVYNNMVCGKEDVGEVEFSCSGENIEPKAMVICRNNKPLLEYYFYLLSINKKCIIEGDDIIGSIKRTLSGYGKSSINSAITDIEDELTQLKDSKEPKDKRRFYNLTENLEMIRCIVDNLNIDEYEQVQFLIKKLDVLHEGPEESIVLSTIHKSKGLEADNVYILNEYLIPSKFAITDEELLQEENLRYVARTRARQKLGFIDFIEPTDNTVEKDIWC